MGVRGMVGDEEGQEKHEDGNKRSRSRREIGGGSEAE